MRQLLLILFMILLTCGILIQDAEAKRFGGGRSFGMQRSVSNTSKVQTPHAQAAAPASTASKWLGPLAGLAAGGLLAYLFMGHGLGTSLLTWLAIAAVGLLLWNLFRNKFKSPQQTAPANAFRENTMQQSTVVPFAPATQHPAGFDADLFLRDAKGKFIRLQAAYDTKNLNDLHEFTLPEVFAEIQLQLQERGDAVNQTDVVSLNADLEDVTTEYQSTIASVRFSGLIREEANAEPQSFNEVWHFKKENAALNWMVAGIQQN